MKLEKGQPLYRQLQELLWEYIRRESPALLPTEKEIMAHYGVSRKTVRKAIAGLAQSGVVTAIAGKGTLVNYRRESDGLLLLLDELHVLPPYEYEIYTAVRDALQRGGIPVTVQLINPADPTLNESLSMLRNRKDKILMFSSVCNRDDVFRMLADRRRDILSVGFRPTQDFNAVYPDVYHGFCQAVNHLLESGHRRIGCVGLRRDRERHTAFSDSLARSGITSFDHLWLESIGTRAGGYGAAEQASLTSGRLDFSALVAHNDLCALGVMEYCLQHRIEIPEELSLTGFDNLADAKNFPVPLTTVGNDIPAFVAAAMQFVAGPSESELRRQPVTMSILIRNSVKKIT